METEDSPTYELPIDIIYSKTLYTYAYSVRTLASEGG